MVSSITLLILLKMFKYDLGNTFSLLFSYHFVFRYSSVDFNRKNIQSAFPFLSARRRRSTDRYTCANKNHTVPLTLYKSRTPRMLRQWSKNKKKNYFYVLPPAPISNCSRYPRIFFLSFFGPLYVQKNGVVTKIEWIQSCSTADKRAAKIDPPALFAQISMKDNY